jgi:hypothetical protein
MSQADTPNNISPSRRAVLTRVVAGAALAGAAGVNMATIAASRPTEADPVLAAIREHREAQAELKAACDANDLDIDECPRKAAAENRAKDSELPLFTTRPTTALGVAALLLYVNSAAHEICREKDGQTVIEYARGWENDTELQDAIARFPQHIDDAFQAITEGGVRG